MEQILIFLLPSFHAVNGSANILHYVSPGMNINQHFPISQFILYSFFPDKYSSKENIVKVAKQLGLTTFVELLQRTFLHWTLRASRLLTVFIPSNEALKNFFTTAAGIEVLKDNHKLRVFILMHVVGGKWPTHLMRVRKRLECILPGKWRELNLQFYGKVRLFS